MPGAALWSLLLSSCSTHTALQWRRLHLHHGASEPRAHHHTRVSLGGPEPSSRQARAASGSRWSGTWGHPRTVPVTPACSMAGARSQATSYLEHHPCVLPTLWGSCAQKPGPKHPFTVGAVTEQDLPSEALVVLGSVLLHPGCSAAPSALRKRTDILTAPFLCFHTQCGWKQCYNHP